MAGGTNALRACLFSRDFREFDLAVEEMHRALGQNWGELSFDEAPQFLRHAEAQKLSFMVVAVDPEDRPHLDQVKFVIQRSRPLNLPCILLAEDLDDWEITYLEQAGVAKTLRYPLENGAFLKTLQDLGPAKPAQKTTDTVMLPIFGTSGGVGASTLALNLAWELSALPQTNVCLMDFDLQFGSMGRRLELCPANGGLDLITGAKDLSRENLDQSVQHYGGGLDVLTAPSEITRFDLLDSMDVDHVLDWANDRYDYVVIDMPKAIMAWTETVFSRADTILCPIEMTVPAVQNALRLRSSFRAEGLPFEKLELILNKGPSMIDKPRLAQVDRIRALLDCPLDLMLPDGGNAVDQGQILAKTDQDNPLKHAIETLALDLDLIHRPARMVA